MLFNGSRDFSHNLIPQGSEINQYHRINKLQDSLKAPSMITAETRGVYIYIKY